MHIDDPGIGDHILDRGARADIVAVDHSMNGTAIDQPLHGLDVGGVAHLHGVFEIGFERTAQNAAQRIDFLAGEREPVLEFDAVRGGEVRERSGLSHRNGGSGGAGAIVDAGEHRRAPGERGRAG